MVLARHADRLPRWGTVYPFESVMALVSFTNGLGFLLRAIGGQQPLGGLLPAWTLFGLPLILIASAILLTIAILSKAICSMAPVLYTMAFAFSMYAFLIIPNGVSVAEVPSLLQIVGTVIIIIVRASHMRAAAKAINRLYPQE